MLPAQPGPLRVTLGSDNYVLQRRGHAAVCTLSSISLAPDRRVNEAAIHTFTAETFIDSDEFTAPVPEEQVDEPSLHTYNAETLK